MGGADKVFAEAGGRPLIAWSLAAFQSSPVVERVVLVLAAENVARGQKMAAEGGFSKVTAVVAGGERRQDSVRAGLEALGECEYVAVHDGARPLVTGELIERGLEAARETGAAVPVVPLADTVKELGEGYVLRTLERERLAAVQTPQVFRHDLLMRAHQEVIGDVTDDASLVEALGVRVRTFEGERRNVKVTTPEDLEWVMWVVSRGGESSADEKRIIE